MEPGTNRSMSVDMVQLMSRILNPLRKADRWIKMQHLHNDVSSKEMKGRNENGDIIEDRRRETATNGKKL